MHLPKLINVHGINYLILSEHYDNKLLNLNCKIVKERGVPYKRIVYPNGIVVVLIYAYGVLCDALLIDNITYKAAKIDKFTYTKNGKEFAYNYGTITSSKSNGIDNVFTAYKKILIANIEERFLKYGKEQFCCPICGDNNIVYNGDLYYAVTKDFYVRLGKYSLNRSGHFNCGNMHVINRALIPRNVCFFNIPSWDAYTAAYYGDYPCTGALFFYNGKQWYRLSLSHEFANVRPSQAKQLLASHSENLLTFYRLNIKDTNIMHGHIFKEKAEINKRGLYIGFVDDKTLCIRDKVKSTIPQLKMGITP